jgi:hypothetical protein
MLYFILEDQAHTEVARAWQPHRKETAMSGKYHDRFSKAISELERQNAYVCASCNISMKSIDKRDHTRHAEQAHRRDHAS